MYCLGVESGGGVEVVKFCFLESQAGFGKLEGTVRHVAHSDCASRAKTPGPD